MDQTDNILDDVKSNIGISNDIKAFDEQILSSINTSFVILFQEGVGQQTTPFICNDTSIWTDFIKNNQVLNMAKIFVYKKANSMFNPSQNSVLNDANNEILKELEWRLSFDYELNKGASE